MASVLKTLGRPTEPDATVRQSAPLPLQSARESFQAPHEVIRNPSITDRWPDTADHHHPDRYNKARRAHYSRHRQGPNMRVPPVRHTRPLPATGSSDPRAPNLRVRQVLSSSDRPVPNSTRPLVLCTPVPLVRHKLPRQGLSNRDRQGQRSLGNYRPSEAAIAEH